MQRKRFQKRPARITLRDVINHMSHMEQRLTARLDKHDGMFVAQGKHLDANTVAIENIRKAVLEVEEHLTNRIHALDEDLTAIITDTIVIRRHVGMPLPEEV